MPRKPRKFCVSKPTFHKIDRREHNLGKRNAATCLVKIAHNSVSYEENRSILAGGFGGRGKVRLFRRALNFYMSV